MLLSIKINIRLLIVFGFLFFTCLITHTNVLFGNTLPVSHYSSGDTFYVWAPSGLLLRKTPSPSGKVIKKLSYGTPVTILKQEIVPIPFQYEYYSNKNFSQSLTQVSTERPQVLLKGFWLFVKAGNLKGYLFSSFLLRQVPFHKGESLNNYFIRAFHLKKLKTEKKMQVDNTDSDSPEKYPVIYQHYSSPTNPLKVTFINVPETGNQGDGAEILLPDLSFEEALVFFQVLLPPLADHAFVYKAGLKWEYLLDAVGNTASLTKTQEGILFKWFYGLN